MKITDSSVKPESFGVRVGISPIQHRSSGISKDLDACLSQASYSESVTSSFHSEYCRDKITRKNNLKWETDEIVTI